MKFQPALIPLLAMVVLAVMLAFPVGRDNAAIVWMIIFLLSLIALILASIRSRRER